ncbi:Putative dihydroxyacetone kinase, ADP-binding subunit [hydrothermal vent metagenome]|uniref:Dihydroxyacetone kinase, ADP-binding subunit n=1 Tax=hydrothermal vent metagenome TaxID=652676 RepID=A0A3B0TPG8_9ZZZZ
MESIDNVGAGAIVAGMAAVIVKNKIYLSEIDGKIGDGDHGVNMAKGFAIAAENIAGKELTLDAALLVLSDVLMTQIGGSMGPLYGMAFADMAETIAGKQTLDGPLIAAMLRAGLDGVREIGEANVGDKTLLDSFSPAVDAFEAALAQGNSLALSLDKMKVAAENGRDSTIDMVAKVGRAARLGERSRGALDAGATSCCMLLGALAEGIQSRI